MTDVALSGVYGMCQLVEYGLQNFMRRRDWRGDRQKVDVALRHDR
jgi:hypothetical protein